MCIRDRRRRRHYPHFRPPTCITDLLEYPGLSTMHHYFYNYPWLTVCPFNQVTLLIEWFTLPVCLRLLWVLLQNMKYMKSRGLQGSCRNILSQYMIYTGGIRDIYITVSFRQLTSSASSIILILPCFQKWHLDHLGTCGHEENDAHEVESRM